MNRLIIIVCALILVATIGIVISSKSQRNSEKNILSQNITETPTSIPTPTYTSTTSASVTITNKPSPTISPTTELKDEMSATIKTSKGEITLTLYAKEAPNTIKNFITKSKSGFYNNLTFHRVEDWVIQGGDPLGNGTGGKDMPTELNNKPFVIGALGVARGMDIKISNDAQFFITKKDSRFLDKKYTNFGIVTSGMNVVNKIAIGDKILGITIE